jgi:ankyrin repeat protein
VRKEADVPTVPLPDNPDLGQLRTRARELQRAARAGDPDALALVAENHPAGVPEPPDRERLRLSTAQLVLARLHGFASWPRLVRHVERVNALTRNPDPAATGDPGDDFLRFACLTYDVDGPDRWARARAILAEHPDLMASSIHAAAAAADAAATARLVGDHPEAARREGGPFGWAPLLYLAYSRLDARVPEADVVRTARLLLAAGADPNDGYLWHGLTTPFTALTGVLGGGELGLAAQPHHPHAPALARVLLDAGADPNDGQGLYNRMFEPDDSHLVLLFEYGLGRGDGGPWRSRLGDAVDTPAGLLRAQLSWAVSHGMPRRVQLLIDHGVDVRSPYDVPSFGVPADRLGRTPIELALLAGYTEVVDVLVTAGEPMPALDPVDELVAAVLAGDAATAEGLLSADPGLAGRVAERRPTIVLDAAAAGRPAAVALALDLGFDVNAAAEPPHGRGMGETALHEAAMNGEREIVEMLLAAGADRSVRDARFDATPAGWAHHGDQPGLAAILEPPDAQPEPRADPRPSR